MFIVIAGAIILSPTVLNFLNRAFEEELIPNKRLKALVDKPDEELEIEEPRLLAMDVAVLASEALELDRLGAISILRDGQRRYKQIMGEGTPDKEKIMKLGLCRSCHRPGCVQ